MKKRLAGLVALTLVAGCGTKTVVVEKAPDTVAPVTTPVQPPAENADTRFMNNITADFPYEVSKLGKSKTLEMGHLVCKAIDEGATVEDFALLAVRNNVDGGFIGALIRESVHNFCPSNQWFIDSALNA